MFGKGVLKQAKEVITSIFNHPIKTLTVVAGTSAAIMALPLVGVPTAVGGAALALGFAGIAGVKTIKHIIQFLRNSHKEAYDNARKNLEQLGGDSVDLALSAPFIPKAIKEVRKFVKYGKLSVNTQAIKGLMHEKGLNAKWQVLKDANNEAGRIINYNQASEVELAKIKGITEAEKAKIKQYLIDYNVPIEKIPEVTLEQWAKEHGVTTKPNLRYQSLDKKIYGYASGKDCSITLNDYKENIVKINGNCDSVRYQQLGPAKRDAAGKYTVDYKDVQTGQIFRQTIDAKLIDDRNLLLKQYNQCSEEAQRILTTTHERTHINQYARFYQNGETITGLTPQAENLYKQMTSELPAMDPTKAAYYKKMFHYNPSRRTVVAYTANPMEIQARFSEAELLKQQRFQTLDKVFKLVKTMKISDISKYDIILNALRAQSATS